MRNYFPKRPSCALRHTSSKLFMMSVCQPPTIHLSVLFKLRSQKNGCYSRHRIICLVISNEGIYTKKNPKVLTHNTNRKGKGAITQTICLFLQDYMTRMYGSELSAKVVCPLVTHVLASMERAIQAVDDNVTYVLLLI